ncbi:putative Outer membrane chaperone Skp (OmpH) [Nitrospina gracilis 3/211]|uniref:Putative Outer membrane chaperone Skp (OmpH) n=1 Tax=Nitrospina gracilis (strain 3/211) TaxID=1266370 RepID=M1YVP6_NITG3|nr:putative Outer membrane chaperone Skp (OmpH) [Nitrospina gracilis 3/211]
MNRSGDRLAIVWKCVLVLGLAWASLPLSGTHALAADVKIGFINMQEAVSRTKEFKNALNKFKADFEEEKKRIALKEKRVQKLLEEINKQSFVLDPNLKKKKEERFIQEKKDLERYVQDRNDEFARKEQEITNRILKKMLDVIKKIGKQKKLTMILEQKTVFYSDDSADLTQLATDTYNRMNK